MCTDWKNNATDKNDCTNLGRIWVCWFLNGLRFIHTIYYNNIYTHTTHTLQPPFCKCGKTFIGIKFPLANHLQSSCYYVNPQYLRAIHAGEFFIIQPYIEVLPCGSKFETLEGSTPILLEFLRGETILYLWGPVISIETWCCWKRVFLWSHHFPWLFISWCHWFF